MLTTYFTMAVLAVGAVAQSTAFYSLDSGFQGIGRRQQYKPPAPKKCTGGGNTCESACGAGSQFCSQPKRFCFNPTEAETCCEAGTMQAWACPNGDYCLVDGYCCPKDQDPVACAKQFSVTLPSTFRRPTGTAPPVGTGTATRVIPHNTAASSGGAIPTYPRNNGTFTPSEPTATGPATVVTAAARPRAVPGAIGVVALVGALVYGQAV